LIIIITFLTQIYIISRLEQMTAYNEQENLLDL